MKHQYLGTSALVLVLLIVGVNARAEENVEILCTSPSGAYRVETRETLPAKSADEPTNDVWIVSTKDPAQRVALPKQAADSPADDEIHFSPNEEWIFGQRHVGSGLRYGNIYHLLGPTQIEAIGPPGAFNDLVWEQGAKLGALKEDHSASGVYAMTFFEGWSFDSSRVLLKLCGGEKKSAMQCGFLYFNTATKKFEVTPYSRKLGRTKVELIACAEPVAPLADEAALRKRFEALDGQLNKKYAEMLAGMEKDRVGLVREGQRKWLKERDAGEKFYLEQFPAAERVSRRLQFLGDVTAARIELPPDQWEL